MGGGLASPPPRQMHEKLQKEQQQTLLEAKVTKIGNTEGRTDGKEAEVLSSTVTPVPTLSLPLPPPQKQTRFVANKTANVGERRESVKKVKEKEKKDKERADQKERQKDKEKEKEKVKERGKEEKEKEKSKEIEKEKSKEREKEKEKSKLSDKTQKIHKESKFAARLRRSFRRTDPKSLETKSSTKSAAPQQSAASRNQFEACEQRETCGGGSSGVAERTSLLTLGNLPGLGGYINPALLLDSPDEATPPEFNYQQLSSVATTNSSSISIESNESGCSNDIGRGSGGDDSNYAAAAKAAPKMGAELSSAAAAAHSTLARPTLHKQSSSSSRSEQFGGTSKNSASNNINMAPHNASSRSCSSASDSSAVKLTRLQNFLCKSSGDSSSRSYLGHSNDGFTVSSRNSTSSEWEPLPQSGSFSEPLSAAQGSGVLESSGGCSGVGGSGYYHYSLTSPNNPFLPEITARNYHSSYDEHEEDAQHALELEELDANVTSVKYSAPSAAVSRTGSQEETHGSGSAASTPGQHKRKLFQLQMLAAAASAAAAAGNATTTTTTPIIAAAIKRATTATITAATTITTTSASRCLNPFISDSDATFATKTASSLSSQQNAVAAAATAVAAPIAVPCPTPPSAPPQDMRAKREEFLRATMKICLVVSPPSNKLQQQQLQQHSQQKRTTIICSRTEN